MLFLFFRFFLNFAQISRALKFVRKSLVLDKTNSNALGLFGLLLSSQKRFTVALTVITQALIEDPANMWYERAKKKREKRNEKQRKRKKKRKEKKRSTRGLATTKKKGLVQQHFSNREQHTLHGSRYLSGPT